MSDQVKSEIVQLCKEKFHDAAGSGQYLEAIPMWERNDLWRVRVNVRTRYDGTVNKSGFIKVEMAEGQTPHICEPAELAEQTIHISKDWRC